MPKISKERCKMLLHGNALNSSNQFIDEMGHPVTTVNTVALDTTISKFGGGSMYFNANGYLSIGTTGDFNLGSGDFTVCWWEYKTVASTIAVGQMSNTGGYMGMLLGYQGVSVYMSSNGSAWDIASAKSSGTEKLNQWSFVAVCRKGSNFYIFRDGVQTATWTSTLSLYNQTAPFEIGRYAGTAGLKSYIDEFVVIKGEALWTSAFTPPTDPFSFKTYPTDAQVFKTADYNTSNDAGFKAIRVTDSEPTSDGTTKVRYAICINGVNYSFKNGMWQVVSDSQIGTDGMDYALIAKLGYNEYSLIFQPGTLSIVASLQTTDVYKTPWVSGIEIDFIDSFSTGAYTITTNTNQFNTLDWMTVNGVTVTQSVQAQPVVTRNVLNYFTIYENAEPNYHDGGFTLSSILA